MSSELGTAQPQLVYWALLQLLCKKIQEILQETKNCTKTGVTNLFNIIPLLFSKIETLHQHVNTEIDRDMSAKHNSRPGYSIFDIFEIYQSLLVISTCPGYKN